MAICADWGYATITLKRRINVVWLTVDTPWLVSPGTYRAWGDQTIGNRDYKTYIYSATGSIWHHCIAADDRSNQGFCWLGQTTGGAGSAE